MSGKKIIAIALTIVIVTCIFTACKKQTPDTKISTTSSTVAEMTESVTEESTTAEKTTEQTKESAQTEKSTETQTTKKADSTTKASGSAPSATQKPKEPETTKAPSTTKAPPQTTKAPETTQKPTTTQPTTKAQTIDIDYYINYAKNYGKSIGLEYDSSATARWDTPIGVTATNHDAVIRDIKDALNFYKNVEGDEYFCVWAEKRSDGNYNLFIGYA